MNHDILIILLPLYALVMGFIPILMSYSRITDYALANWFDLRWVIPVQLHGIPFAIYYYLKYVFSVIS